MIEDMSYNQPHPATETHLLNSLHQKNDVYILRVLHLWVWEPAMGISNGRNLRCSTWMIKSLGVTKQPLAPVHI